MTFSKPLLALLSIVVLCCVSLAALQTFVFAPFAVQLWTLDYLKILGIFAFEAGIAVLSLLELRGAALSSPGSTGLFPALSSSARALAASSFVGCLRLRAHSSWSRCGSFSARSTLMIWFRATPSFSENTSAVRRTDGISRSGNCAIAFLRISVAISRLSSHLSYQLCRRKYRYSEALSRLREVLRVICDQSLSLAVDRNIKHHVVVWISR